jgi:hypothetical protein
MIVLAVFRGISCHIEFTFRFLREAYNNSRIAARFISITRPNLSFFITFGPLTEVGLSLLIEYQAFMLYCGGCVVDG